MSESENGTSARAIWHRESVAVIGDGVTCDRMSTADRTINPPVESLPTRSCLMWLSAGICVAHCQPDLHRASLAQSSARWTWQSRFSCHIFTPHCHLPVSYTIFGLGCLPFGCKAYCKRAVPICYTSFAAVDVPMIGAVELLHSIESSDLIKCAAAVACVRRLSD